MSDDRLAAAAREIIKRASAPVRIGEGASAELLVLIPARTLRWLEDALTPEQKTPSAFVVIDPKMKGGTPCIFGHRISADQIADLYWHLGESLQSEILDAYDLTRGDVVVCCFWAATYGTRGQRKRWKTWLDQAWAATRLDGDTGKVWWSDNFEDVPLPPTRQGNQP